MRRAALSLPLLAACAAAPVPPDPAPPGPRAPAARRPSPADRYGAEPAFRASALEAEALAAV
ncbi:MAG TPA: hypothetical protein VH880_08400, partial [Anaeromyxobacteraceae bacterium]